jgi:redox-sensitive bicupin YhaK (pirin superfamily)
MIVERRSTERGRIQAGWLDSRHTFSFGHYHDPQWMGFGVLRVINEDRVAPGAGFPPHGHANMEILSYVLSGALAHRDSHGGEGVLRPGELQWMSAGHGIEHSEYNASDTEPVHFLQIWIQPDRVNAVPAWDQRAFDPGARRGDWATLASPDGADGSLAIRQQAWLRGARLGAGERVEAALDPGRRYWLHVAQGAAEADGCRLQAGDALGFVGEDRILVLAGREDRPVELLLFDLPP